ncbi:uncharacterized protein [Eucyclogobius newberryi]|uniref:uncharacterized protein n=1 Tax=Eucyclogobius newberryi TaxID=166745 RepID=UPI003B5B6D67
MGRKGKDEVVLLFPLKLSKLPPENLSFVELLNQVHKETEQCVMSDYNKLSCVFILDGLEDFKLDWTMEDRVRDEHEAAPVTVLLSSLIRGDLLPSALVWITSRPAAAEQVPSALLHRTTHIRDKNAKDELSKQLKNKIKLNVKRKELETELYEIKSESKEEQILSSLLLTRPKGGTVITGVPRIGKTSHSEHFMLDWAEGKFKIDVDFVLSIPLAELNQTTHRSLQDLLNQCVNSEVSKVCYYSEYKIIIILDGLDRCELPLDFENNQELSSITAAAPVDQLLTNLVQGNLLPSARLWILTRPSGQNKIPEQHIHTVTQCRESVDCQMRLVSNLKERFKQELQTTNKSHQKKTDTELVLMNTDTKPVNLTSLSGLFKAEKGEKVRTVLTVAEKDLDWSHHVQQFIQDWAKAESLLGRIGSSLSSWMGRKDKDEVVLLFPLKLSKLPQENLSFVELLNQVHKETEQCVMSDYNKLSCVFILDGLEDFKLDWTMEDRVRDEHEAAPVTVLLSSLIRGDLLPSALVWITSRPAAAEQVPPALLHRTTHIRDKNAKDELSKQLKDKIKLNVKRKELETDLYEIKSESKEEQILSSLLLTRPKGGTVITTGVPRIGKTSHSEHFMLDWAEGKFKNDIDFVLSIPLAELNQTTHRSLQDLLNQYLNRKVSRGCYYSEYKIIIILDGLDRCELPLDFENNQKLSSITAAAPVDQLLTNLVQGNLLPSARLWILTRPSGQNKIPEQHIHTVTQCRETKKRQQMLVFNLKNFFSQNYTFKEDPSHPNQKNTEHIRPDRVDVNGKKQQITMSDLFIKEADRPIRTVLTAGEAEVGKSYLVRKFIHRWLCSDKKETKVLFLLTYSKLHTLTQNVSFVELLNRVHKETEQCVMSDYNKLSCVFILDGLEDFKLDWTMEDRVRDEHEAAPVTVLLSSLIRGDLLPSALVWITSRPAAAEQVPSALLHRTSHIREKPDVVSQRYLKRALIKRYESVAEGVDRASTTAVSLKDIYTDLYIIEEEKAEVYQQSETRQVQQGKNVEVRKEIPIKYQDIFKASADRPKDDIKTVLTTGVAGIGKTFASMKYMLDWAEGTSSPNINMTFPLPFRELNLRKDLELSLEELLYEFFPCMKTSEITNYEQYKVLIVLDGLDECRLDLNFGQTQILSDIGQKTTVNNLLTNLILGNLLPKAQVWITSRPAASLCIPADKVERVTEVRGFNDEQKEEYFKKRFDSDLAEKVLGYVKESRCIYLMCKIPVFCWITEKVLESFVQNHHHGIPKTLTDLFIHFLLLQCRQANAKYNEATEEGSKIWNKRNVKCILGLSQMAFEELEKGNLLFTEDDLTSYELDVEESAVYSGLLTKVRRDESEVYPTVFFSFVHLSVQEFLAAFYVFHTFNNEGKNVLSSPPSSEQSASDFYKSAVDKALENTNGDLDLFLRFLLGLSLQTNHDLLKEVLKMFENMEKINKETIAYIKTKIDEKHSDTETSMNLFHCLNELNDHSLVEEIKKYLHSEKNDYESFSPSKWSALTFVLLTSDQNLDLFDLKKYCKSEDDASGKSSKNGCTHFKLLCCSCTSKVHYHIWLSWCGLSERASGALSNILTSPCSNLTELDLSHNELMDSGVEKVSDGLKYPHCKLKILRLAGCRVSESGCMFLISALKSNKSSQLEVLDLSYNHPGPEGERLKTLETDPNVKLKEVCLDHCCAHRLKSGLRKYTADLTFDAKLKHPKIIFENQKALIREKVSVNIPEARGAVSVRHVFCEQELSGLCYWELEWDGTVGIGVAYKGAATKNVLGFDDKSWSVFCSNQPDNCLEFEQKQARVPVKNQRKMLKFPSQKMAVYLDWQAGTLSYYSVTPEELSLITTFKATFKQPLVPTFWMLCGSVTLC